MSEGDVLKDLLKGLGGLREDGGFGEEDAKKAGGMLEELIDGYGQLSEEEKTEFRQTAQEKMMARMQEAMTSHITQAYFSKIGILIACVLVMLVIFVFFGYKLIKNIKEKERKKEEKKKQKQSKKKK